MIGIMGYFLAWLAVWILSAAIIAATAYLLPGVSVKNFWTALLVALVLGFVNLFIRPLLLLLTLPFNIITFGLFTFVINALMILLVAAIVPDFKVKGFGSALLFSIIISLLRILLLEMLTV